MQPFELIWGFFSTVKPKLKLLLGVTAAGGMKERKMPPKHPLTLSSHLHAPARLLSLPSGLSLATFLSKV